MKINRLSEGTKMKFMKEDYDDQFNGSGSSVGVEVPMGGNPIYLIDSVGTYIVELTIDEITEILISKGLKKPLPIRQHQSKIYETLRRDNRGNQK